MPKLNDIYEEYGCNKGELVVIMDGFNIYHDNMKARYVDSLGGIFPMLCVQDNLDSLHYLKKEFPGAAPTYGLVSPNKEILHSSRSYNDFKAALDALNLKKQPEICDDITPVTSGNTLSNKGQAVVRVGLYPDGIRLAVPEDGEYMITVYTIDGKCIEHFQRQCFTDRNCTVHWNRTQQTDGIYLVRVEGAGIKESVKTVLVH